MIKAANSQSIAEAAVILKDGGLVGMPTETVYGLAANALDGEAVARIFEAKGRPAINPLIIHVPNIQSAEAFVEVSERARIVAQGFWPGPLTMILPRKAGGGGFGTGECWFGDFGCAGAFASGGFGVVKRSRSTAGGAECE